MLKLLHISHFFVKVFQFESKNRILFALENIQIILNINKKNQKKKKLPLECSRIYILEYMKTILKHIKINEQKRKKENILENKMEQFVEAENNA